MPNLNIIGNIKLVSVNPETEPDFVAIGGFSVFSEDGDVIFDWCSASGSYSTNENGHCVLEWEMSEFDEEYFESSNEKNSPDFNKIVDGIINEVQYEAGYIRNGKEEHFEMDLVEFQIVLYDDKYEIEQGTFTFSPEEIKAYNERVQAQREKDKLKASV